MTTTSSPPRFVITVGDNNDYLTGTTRNPSAQSNTLDTDPEVQLVYVATPVKPDADSSDIEIVYHRRATDKQSLPPIEPVALDEDITMVGEHSTICANSFYPHFYHVCEDSHPCSKCFCFVCDVPIRQCCYWLRHRFATDDEPWRSLRRAMIKTRNSSRNAICQSNKI